MLSWDTHHCGSSGCSRRRRSEICWGDHFLVNNRASHLGPQPWTLLGPTMSWVAELSAGPGCVPDTPDTPRPPFAAIYDRSWPRCRPRRRLDLGCRALHVRSPTRISSRLSVNEARSHSPLIRHPTMLVVPAPLQRGPRHVEPVDRLLPRQPPSPTLEPHRHHCIRDPCMTHNNTSTKELSRPPVETARPNRTATQTAFAAVDHYGESIQMHDAVFVVERTLTPAG